MLKLPAFSANIWTAVAERSGDTAFEGGPSAPESGVALRFPPQSTVWWRLGRPRSVRVHSYYYA
jgi:hypothetical protein